MKKQRLKKIIQAATSYLVIFAMIFSIISPYISQALTTAEVERIEQQKWNDILSADLNGDEASAVSDVSVATPTDLLKEPTDDDFGGADTNMPEYRTDRFIIKYKSEEAKTTTESKLAKKYEVKNPKAIDAIEKNNLNKTKTNNGKNNNQTNNNGKHFGQLKNASIIKANKPMTANELINDMQTSGIDAGLIEYVQPDYEMTVSDISNTGNEVAYIDYSVPENNTSDATTSDINNEIVTDILNTEEQITNAEETAETTTISEEEISDTQQININNTPIIALLDTGVDTSHPDLAGHILAGWDFVNDDDSVNDSEWYYDQAHGTMIAGIIASVSPEVKIIPLKIFQGGMAYTSDIIAAIEYAETMGATVVNCSWGSGYENAALREAMENSGMLFVCATGNALYNIDKYPIYPASFNLPNTISVASVSDDGKLSRFSNYGPETVDIAARGENINTTWLENRYNTGNGTSMSAGFVSGLASLVQAKFDYTASEIKYRIIESADTITGLQNKVKNGKRINFEYAVSDNLAPNPTVIDIPDNEELPEIVPYGEITEEDNYEEFGAENYVDIKANMPTPRQGLQVVELGGKIYAIGGQTTTTVTGGESNIVEVYDPIADTWTTAASMNTARSYFGAVAYDNMIYVFGGYDGSTAISSVEMYNPLTNTWTDITGFDRMVALYDFATVLNPATGKVYILGGKSGHDGFISGVLNCVFEYTISTKTWVQCAALNNARSDFSAVLYDNRYIYMLCGIKHPAGMLNDYEETYDITNYTTSPASPLGMRALNTVCINTNDRILTINGRSDISNTAKYTSIVSHSLIGDIFSNRVVPSIQYVTHTNIARACHGAVLVNGKVYVIGGMNVYGLVNTVEEIDLGWQEKAPLPVALKNFSTAENNGRLYVFGGEKLVNGINERSKAVYEYNPTLNQWTQKADLPFYISEAEFVSAYGKIYLTGGRMASNLTSGYSFITNIYEYDTNTNIWTQKCALQIQKYSFGSILFKGKIYSAGGYGSTGALSTVEIYDPITNITMLKNNFPTLIYGAKMYVMNERLYLLNGNNIYIYDEKTDTWAIQNSSGPVSFVSGYYGEAVIYDNLYSINYLDNSSIVPRVYKYLPNENIWSEYSTFNFMGMIQHTECVNSRMYIFTGASDYSDKLVEYVPSISPWARRGVGQILKAQYGTACLNGKIYASEGSFLYEYDTQTNTWTNKTMMNYDRTYPAVAVASNKMYLIGGHSPSINAVNNVEEYDPATNTWANKTALPVATDNAAAASVNDKIYVFGGKDVNGNVLNTVREYDPSTDTWTIKANMPTARYGAGAVAINGQIYVAGGFTINNEINPTDVLEVYDPATNTWDTTRANMPYPVAYGAAAGKDNMYWICGTDGYNQMTDVLEYSPVLDKWFRWMGPNFASYGAGAAVTEEGIYYISGETFAGNYGTMFSANYGTMEFAPISDIYTVNEYIHMGKDYIDLTGNFSRTYVDMSVQSPGFTMNFSRTYNSRDDRDESKGNIISKGWTFGFQGKLDQSGSNVTIRLPNGSGSTFRQNPDGSFTAKDTRSNLVKSGTEYILTTKDQYTYTFNSGGYLTEMKDHNGNAVTITVDAFGKPTQIKDQANRIYTVNYTSNRITDIVENITGRTVTYGYDAYNRLSSVADPNGNMTYYTYTTNDANGYLATIKNNNGVVVEGIEYYPLNSGETLPKVMKVTNINGNADNYSYNNNAGKLTILDNYGREMGTWFDKSIYPIKKMDTEGRETRIAYFTDEGLNKYGEIASQTDRNGNTTNYDRDSNGNVTRVINPDGSTKEYTYDGRNNLLSEKDEEGKMTYYVYDASGINIVKKAKPLDGVTPYSISANQSLFAIESCEYYTAAEATAMCGKVINGLLKTKTDGENGVTTYTYDANGYVKTVKDASNNTTTDTYNSIGFLIKEQTPKGYVTNYYYDKNGNLLKKSLNGGETERWIYNALGDMTQHILPKQYTAASDTTTFNTENIVSAVGAYSGTTQGYRYSYSVQRQLTSQTNPNNNVTSYTYDVYGNILTETKPNGGIYTYIYDVMNRVKEKAFQENSASVAEKLQSYEYAINSDGTMRNTTTIYLTSDTDTAVTANTYDYAGRLIRTDNPDGTNTRIEYFRNGLPRVSYDAKNSATYYAYNGLNLLESMWNPANTIGGVVKYSYTGYTYDKCGRTLYTNYGKSVVDLNVVPAGTSVTWKLNAYNPNGTVNTVPNSGGGKTTYEYDADGNMITENDYTSATTANTTQYVYNYLNKPTQKSITVSQTDIYGQTGTGTMLSTTNYTYDLNGNLLTETDPFNVTTTYTYDQMNNLLSSSKPGVDENGVNTTITKSMTYDNMGNISTSKDANGNITTFTYDKMGNLVKTTNALSGVSFLAYDRAG